jgi:hypothetical protein
MQNFVLITQGRMGHRTHGLRQRKRQLFQIVFSEYLKNPRPDFNKSGTNRFSVVDLGGVAATVKL